MKKLISFIRTPLGAVIAMAVFICVGALLIHGGNRHEKPAIPDANAAPPPMERHTITRDGAPLKVPANVAPAQSQTRNASDDTEQMISRPHAARGEQPQQTGKAKQPAVLPISLLSSNASASVAEPLSSHYAPYGRLIPCETIITLESSKIETPIIGLVTEDVWHEGRLIIPAGAEVHGRASTDRSRERIAASGQWVIVWRDATSDNGMELTLNGIALDRERDDATGEFGLRDGSAGLVGTVVKTDDWQEIKLFASTFLAGMASGLQDMQDTGSLGGSGVAIPQATAKNAALAGTSDVLNTYAAQIAKRIEEDGFYVRVPAGKQFYLYATQTLDKAGAKRGNDHAKLWQKDDHENPATTKTTTPAVQDSR